ncbi:hypothetical protein DXG01_009341 [Tephrocybe rancida]|nr:hypothetical protein DXG01_009341 [Tephrocybe rancida]
MLKCRAQLPTGEPIRNFIAKALKATGTHPSRHRNNAYIRAVYFIDLMNRKGIRTPKNPCLLFIIALMISFKIGSDQAVMMPQVVWLNLVREYTNRQELNNWERAICQDLNYNLKVLGTEHLQQYEQDFIEFFSDEGIGAEISRHTMESGPLPEYQSPPPDYESLTPMPPAGNPASMPPMLPDSVIWPPVPAVPQPSCPHSYYSYPTANPSYARWYAHPNYPKLVNYGVWGNYCKPMTGYQRAVPFYPPPPQQLWAHYFDAQYYYPTYA